MPEDCSKMAIHLTPPEPVEEVLSPALVYAHHPGYSVAMKSEFDAAKKTAKEMKKKSDNDSYAQRKIR